VCGWAGGQGPQPGDKPFGAAAPGAQSARPRGRGQTRVTSASPPGAWSAQPWTLGQTKSARGALVTTPTNKPPKCRVALDFLFLGCSPSATWRLGCLYF